MAEEVVLNINVNGEASIGEVKNLKQQFAEAEDALFALAGAGKSGTAEFRKAQQEAANLKERVDDINESLDDLKPEAKLGAFTKVAGGVASGFTAAAGASALFGAESEDLQKQLVKVQAAMAFSEGLKGLGDLGDGFKVLKAVILANPLFLITAVVVGIGTALFALKDKIAIVGKAFDALGRGLSKLVDLGKKFTDSIGATNFALDEQKKKALALNEIWGEQSQRAFDKQISAAKRAGKAIEALEVKKLESFIKYNSERAKLLDASNKEERQQIKDIQELNRIAAEKILDLNDVISDRRAAARAKDLEEQKKTNDAKIAEEVRFAEEQKALAEIAHAEQVANDIEEEAATQRLFAHKKQLEDDAITDTQARRELEKEQALADIEAEFMESNRSNEAYRAAQDAKKLITDEFNAVNKAEEDKLRDEKARLDAEAAKKLKAQQVAATQGAMQATAMSIEAGSVWFNQSIDAKLKKVKKGSAEELKLEKKKFETNKKLQLAQAAIQAAQATLAAFSSGAAVPIIGVAMGPLFAAAAAAVGLANIAKIRNTRFSGGGGGGGGGVSAPSISVPSTASANAPVVNAPVNATTQISEEGEVIDNAAPQTIKAFVVESDITNKQADAKKIEEQATY